MTCKFNLDQVIWPPSDVERLTAAVKKIEIPDQIIKFENEDDPKKDVKEVEGVWFDCCQNLIKFPKNLNEFFPNMIALAIYKCDLKKITRSDFKGLQSLREIAIIGTEIESLEADLFRDLVNIEEIILNSNKIKFIDKNVFDGLNKLKYVNLRYNPTIDVLFAIDEYKKVDEPAKTRFYKLFELKLFIDGIYHSKKCNNVCEDLKSVYESEDFKDFTIKIDETELKVHKLILIARSPTIADMLRNNPEAEDLILQDIEVDVFNVVLDYIYNDSMPMNDDKLTQIFAAAGKLKLEKLRNFIGAQLCDLIDENNALEMLKLATKQNHEELKQKSFEEIKKMFHDKKLKDDLIDDVEKLEKLIAGKQAYEEMIRKAEEKFQRLMSEVE